MVDDSKTGGIRRLGQERWKYLDMANMAFSAQNWTAVEGYIKAFLETIKDDSSEAKEIKIEFDRIDRERKMRFDELQRDIAHLGFLEQRDVLNNGREQIEIEAIHNRKAMCWTVALNNGLFNA